MISSSRLIVSQPLYFYTTPQSLSPSFLLCLQENSTSCVAMNNSPWMIPSPSACTFDLPNGGDVDPFVKLDPVVVTLCPLGIQAPMIAPGISFVEETQPGPEAESSKRGRYRTTTSSSLASRPTPPFGRRYMHFLVGDTISMFCGECCFRVFRLINVLLFTQPLFLSSQTTLAPTAPFTQRLPRLNSSGSKTLPTCFAAER